MLWRGSLVQKVIFCMRFQERMVEFACKLIAYCPPTHEMAHPEWGLVISYRTLIFGVFQL